MLAHRLDPLFTELPRVVDARYLLHPPVHNVRHLHPVEFYLLWGDSHRCVAVDYGDKLLFVEVELLEDKVTRGA